MDYRFCNPVAYPRNQMAVDTISIVPMRSPSGSITTVSDMAGLSSMVTPRRSARSYAVVGGGVLLIFLGGGGGQPLIFLGGGAGGGGGFRGTNGGGLDSFLLIGQIQCRS